MKLSAEVDETSKTDETSKYLKLFQKLILQQLFKFFFWSQSSDGTLNYFKIFHRSKWLPKKCFIMLAIWLMLEGFNLFLEPNQFAKSLCFPEQALQAMKYFKIFHRLYPFWTSWSFSKQAIQVWNISIKFVDRNKARKSKVFLCKLFKLWNFEFFKIILWTN